MKPQVTIEIESKNGETNVCLSFNTLEELDEFLGTLVEMRDDLEEQIEREKQRRYEKRKRRKNKKRFEDALIKEFDKLMNEHAERVDDESNANVSYAKLDEILKDFNKSLEEYMSQIKDKKE